jgi:hypothetical protein
LVFREYRRGLALLLRLLPGEYDLLLLRLPFPSLDRDLLTFLGERRSTDIEEREEDLSARRPGAGLESDRDLERLRGGLFLCDREDREDVTLLSLLRLLPFL